MIIPLLSQRRAKQLLYSKFMVSLSSFYYHHFIIINIVINIIINTIINTIINIIIIITTGDEDMVVNYAWGLKTSDFLKLHLTSSPTFLTIQGMGHSSDPDEIRELKSFLESKLL